MLKVSTKYVLSTFFMVYGGDIGIKTRKVQSTWWSPKSKKSTLVEYVLRVRTHFSIFSNRFFSDIISEIWHSPYFKHFGVINFIYINEKMHYYDRTTVYHIILP